MIDKVGEHHHFNGNNNAAAFEELVSQDWATVKMICI
jgi:hypothetical protein